MPWPQGIRHFANLQREKRYVGKNQNISTNNLYCFYNLIYLTPSNNQEIKYTRVVGPQKITEQAAQLNGHYRQKCAKGAA